MLCSNCDKSAVVNKLCKVGCIGYMRCEKTCTIRVEDFIVCVDLEKCVGCGDCVAVCPRYVITLLGSAVKE